MKKEEAEIESKTNNVRKTGVWKSKMEDQHKKRKDKKMTAQ